MSAAISRTLFAAGLIVAILASSLMSTAISTQLALGPKGDIGDQGDQGSQGSRALNVCSCPSKKTKLER